MSAIAAAIVASMDDEYKPCDVAVDKLTGQLWKLCDGMQLDEELHVSESTGNEGQYKFKFPGVSNAVASIYWDNLMSMERRFEIDDFFTNLEISKIVDTIDNHDYVKDVYPHINEWSGLMADLSIFRAIACFKKQNNNPVLARIKRACTITKMTTPMPKHIYYLKFLFSNGTSQIVTYVSHDDELKPD